MVACVETVGASVNAVVQPVPFGNILLVTEFVLGLSVTITGATGR